MSRLLVVQVVLVSILAAIITLAHGRDIFPYPSFPIRYVAATYPFVQRQPPPMPRQHSKSDFPWRNDRPNYQAAFSCTRKCALPPHPSWPCQCHSECQELDNCCHDYESLCYTCNGRCNKFLKLAPCQCNKKCVQFNNCCDDYERKCSSARARLTTSPRAYWAAKNDDDTSCVDRCGTLDPSKPCQCNSKCEYFEDCCPDYEAVCVEFPTTCKERCDEDYNPLNPCHCNDKCTEHDNCCEDYSEVCEQEPGGVTDEILATLSEELLALDVTNNIAPFVTVNLQGKSPQDGSDQASRPLLTVDPAAYLKPTVAKLIKLHDNYEAEVGVREDDTPQEQSEVKEFLDEVLSTPIMLKTAAFLAEKGFIPHNFRETFHKIWFGIYSRASNGAPGSSGFEHVFLGELKNGVSGFHHWAFWALEESRDDLNYKGYVAQHSLGSKGMALSESFEWRNVEKPISSMFIGPSPEFELAVYTICWYARPNAICPLVLNGKKVKVQTYDIVYKNEKYIGTSYVQ